jgi:hypothetical protein
MIRRLATVAAAATALGLALAGCGDANSGGGGGDAVAWAEKVCKSVEGDLAVLTKTPDVDPSNPQQAKESLVTYLGSFATALDHMASGIRDAGTPPVADGAKAVDTVSSALAEAKTSVESAKTNLEQANVSDPASFQAAFTKVGEDMAKLSSLDDPTKDLKANKELNDAFEQAPTCKKLDGDGTSTPPST